MKTAIHDICLVIVLMVGTSLAQDAPVNATKLEAAKIALPLIPFPINKCCTLGKKTAIMSGIGSQWGFLPGVSVGFSNNSPLYASKSCSRVAMVKINFNKGGGLGCGRRMLKIDLSLGKERRGHMINLGDSSTNNGYAGDANTQQNDAELHGVYPRLTLWGSDKCKSKNLASLSNFLANTNRVIIYVSNEFIRFTDGNDVNYRICKNCLYALNGQSDNQGSSNENVYLSLNKVIYGNSRFGYGVCRATMNWVCNMCDYETL